MSARRGDVWTLDNGVDVLVISSTVYNEIASEPTVVVVPVFDSEPDTGFGTDLGTAPPAGATGLGQPGLLERVNPVLNEAKLGQPFHPSCSHDQCLLGIG